MESLKDKLKSMLGDCEPLTNEDRFHFGYEEGDEWYNFKEGYNRCMRNFQLFVNLLLIEEIGNDETEN